jgi:type I restriction enzyme S subunit
MKSSYSELGVYIREVNERNSDLAITNLLGVSMEKTFIPSVANLNGVDMSVYKVLKNEQLACKLMSVGRDEKLPVDLYREQEPSIVSSAYYVFEPKDKEELLPEYLMMWLCRPENDRYIGFISGGDVRGGISWETFCSLPIKVPSISKQQEIVKEYKVIQKAISLNSNLIQKFQETIKAIYRQWFLEFEFPDKNGNPFKSNGGEMVWSEELEKEIPNGWQLTNLGSISTIKAGGDKPKVFSENITDKNKIPIYSNSSNNEGLFGYTNKAVIEKSSITISARGAIIGYTVLRTTPFVPIVRLIVVIPNEDYLLNYIYETIKDNKYDDSGSAQGQLTIPDVYSFEIMLPTLEILKKYQKIALVISNMIETKTKENQKLSELKELLLSKLATIEN